MCNCNEGKTFRTVARASGGRIFEEKETPTELNVHNCDYVAWRNSFIPQAERMANQQASPDRDEAGWRIAFKTAMAELTASGQ